MRCMLSNYSHCCARGALPPPGGNRYYHPSPGRPSITSERLSAFQLACTLVGLVDHGEALAPVFLDDETLRLSQLSIQEILFGAAQGPSRIRSWLQEDSATDPIFRCLGSVIASDAQDDAFRAFSRCVQE